jgi:hypothetical protein
VSNGCGDSLPGKNYTNWNLIQFFRNNYPKFLRIDGGSDWVIIHRDFAKFAISDLEVPTQLRKMFKSILLPLEGFFHTVILQTALHVPENFLAFIEYSLL